MVLEGDPESVIADGVRSPVIGDCAATWRQLGTIIRLVTGSCCSINVSQMDEAGL